MPRLLLKLFFFLGHFCKFLVSSPRGFFVMTACIAGYLFIFIFITGIAGRFINPLLWLEGCFVVIFAVFYTVHHRTLESLFHVWEKTHPKN